ncbi:hypothetical protein TELCIR_21008, partial [Teladorsagia circumcincta]
GALNTFLKENANKVEVKDKLDMCLGAALGVEYLHNNQCMHRDLAARNCLITHDRIVVKLLQSCGATSTATVASQMSEVKVAS